LILAGIIVAGLAGERGLGARPLHRHQSLHVRLGAGDDREAEAPTTCPRRQCLSARFDSGGGPRWRTEILEDRDGSIAGISRGRAYFAGVRLYLCGVEELDRAIVFRSCRMIGRAAARRATSLKPARANADAAPTKMFDELFGALVSIGYASSAAAPARFAVFKAAKIS
jgi:hypothetical protein